MKAVILDLKALGADAELQALQALPLDWHIHQTTSPEQVLERIKDADIVLTTKVRLDKALINQCLSLKYIGVMATGTNNIDVAYAKSQNIVVQNISHYSTYSVAQHTMAMMLSLASALPTNALAASNGQWAKSDMFCLLDHPVLELRGKTLLIVGSGALGSEVGRLAEAFGMKLLKAKVPGSSSGKGRIDLDEGLAVADVVSLHCPLTEQTKHLIDQTRLQRMKQTAILINT